MCFQEESKTGHIHFIGFVGCWNNRYSCIVWKMVLSSKHEDTTKLISVWKKLLMILNSVADM